MLRRYSAVALLLLVLGGAASGSASTHGTGTTATRVSAGAPENISLPTARGLAIVGMPLTGTPGSWAPRARSYGFAWLRCAEACRRVERANGATYVVRRADVDSTLRFQVVASNGAGSAVAQSEATGRVVAADPSPAVAIAGKEKATHRRQTSPSTPVTPTPTTPTPTTPTPTATTTTTTTTTTTSQGQTNVAPNPKPAADTSPPSAPGSLTSTGSTGTTLSVAWTPAFDDVGVAGYTVYQGSSTVSTTQGLSATVSGLACGTSYGVSVDAYDAAGNHSARTSLTAATAACPPPPAPQPVSGNSIYWGAYVEARQTYNYLYGGTWSNGPWCDPGTQCPLPKFTADAGKAPSIEHWGMCWTCSFDSAIANVVVGRGDIPAVDWATDSSVSDADVAAGRYDSSITTVAQAMKAFGHPIFLLFDEEMNGTWYPYSPGLNGNTPASFVAMWRHVHDLFVAAGATNVTWVWAPNVDVDGTFTPMSQVYPGDAYVDWTGLNGYNWGGSDWMSFTQVFSSSYGTLLQVAPGKPIMIGEVASEEAGGSKAAWIADALGTQLPQNFPMIKAVLWFNWRIYEKGTYWNWEIESSPAAQQAFATAIGSPYYAAGGGFGNLPLLSKIQPLS